MKTLRYLALVCFAAALPLHAQTVAISASAVKDSFNTPLAAARLCFTPVNAANTPSGFRVGSSQFVPNEVCGKITAGALQGGLTVPPNPSGFFYHIYAKTANANTILRDFGMTPITGSTWTLDTYDPNLAVLPVSAISAGTFTTLAAGAGGSCTVTGAGPYLLNCSVPQGVQGVPGTTTATGTSGNFDVPGLLTTKNFEGIRSADRFAGANGTAQNDAAITDGGASAVILDPPGMGAGNESLYSTTTQRTLDLRNGFFAFRGKPDSTHPIIETEQTTDVGGAYTVQLRPSKDFSRTAIGFGRSPRGTNDGQFVASIEAHGAYTDDASNAFTDKNLIIYTQNTANNLEAEARFECCQLLPRITLGRGAGNEVTSVIHAETSGGMEFRHRASLTIGTCTITSNVAAFTVTGINTSGQVYAPTELITVAGNTLSACNGVWTVNSSPTPTSTTFSASITAANGSGTGGTVFDGNQQVLTLPYGGVIKFRASADNADRTLVNWSAHGTDNPSFGDDPNIDSVFMSPGGTVIARFRSTGVRIGDGNIAGSSLDVGGSFAVNGSVHDGTGLKHHRFSGSCTTAATAGSNCTATLTWPAPFADTLYTPVCWGELPSGTPILSLQSGQAAASIVIQVTAATALASSFGAVYCMAMHD